MAVSGKALKLILDAEGMNQPGAWPGAASGITIPAMRWISAGISRAREKQRVCASGYDNAGTPSFCANVQSVGSCDGVCTFDSEDPEKGYLSCGGSTDVITTYLN